MGREIRKVPAGWQHPTYTEETELYSDRIGRCIPLYDENYDEALANWNAENQLWIEGKHEEQLNGNADKYEYKCYSQYAGEQPNPDYYRHYKDEDCTWFQMYETVSEGTPVTPAFATLFEVEDYLVNIGEMAGTSYNQKFSRAAAHNFCASGWAPSMMMTPETGLISGVAAAEFLP